MSVRNWPIGYQEQLEEIIGVSFDRKGRAALSFDLNSADEAKLIKEKIILMQKQLLAVKKGVNQNMKHIRGHYRVERKKITDTEVLTGFLLSKKFADLSGPWRNRACSGILHSGRIKK